MGSVNILKTEQQKRRCYNDRWYRKIHCILVHNWCVINHVWIWL